MNEKAIILTNQIRKDMAALAVIFTALEQTPLPKLPLTPAKEEKLIVIAYRLHHLYTGFENIFQNIAALLEFRELTDRAVRTIPESSEIPGLFGLYPLRSG